MININSLGIMSKDNDIGKNMAQMRAYINQLKDEIENELMNIGYDNLDADLRKRFDDMQTGLLTANNTSLEIAGMLKTQYLKADEIVATYATIGNLSAVSARVGSLEADHVSTNSFDALSASVATLSAKAITTDNLSAQNISANQINAGKLKINLLEDINGTTGGARWSILGWVQYIERSGNNLNVYYRNFEFLNCGYTAQELVQIPLN